MKRIRIINPSKYLKLFADGEAVRIGIIIDKPYEHIAVKLGFTYPFVAGEKLLPEARLSKSTYENAEGKYVKRTDLPKETLYRYFEWEWEDYAGNSYSNSKFIPYQRFPREFIPPLALELSLLQDDSGNLLIVTEPFAVVSANNHIFKLAMNLFLSLFGEFKTFSNDLKEPINYIRRIPWEILRPGHHTNKEIETYLDQVVSNSPKGKQNMYRRNIDKLRRKKPEIIAVGTAGFSGYLVFYYPAKKIAILESLMPNNATYILDKNWEQISNYTKTQVLSQNMHVDRIFHCDTWDNRIDEYIS